MTDETSAGTPAVDPAPGIETAAPVQASPDALEARVAELETVVHALATSIPTAPHAHGVILPWLEKIGAIFKRGGVKGA